MKVETTENIFSSIFKYLICFKHNLKGVKLWVTVTYVI